MGKTAQHRKALISQTISHSNLIPLLSSDLTAVSQMSIGSMMKQLKDKVKEMVTRARTQIGVDQWLKYQTRNAVNRNRRIAQIMQRIMYGMVMGMNFNYYISLMRTIKLDVNSLEKAKEQVQIENGNKLARESRKKMAMDRVVRSYDPDFTGPIETKQNSPNRTAPEPRQSSHKDQANSKGPDNGVQSFQKPFKSSVKLPTIHQRGNTRTNLITGSEGLETLEETEGSLEPQIRMISNTANGVHKHKSSVKEHSQSKNEGEGLSSFLRYVQLKPVKRQDKSPSKNDLSLRDLKPLKVEKTLMMRANKNSEKKIEQTDTGPKLQKKVSQKISRSRKTEQKSEKVISNYSIRKQKRVLSISQPTKIKKQKITNTYWDFCRFLCLLNKSQRPTTPNGTYKAFVGKGNNSILIKNSLKSRFWWNIVDSESEVNLHWTQCKDAKFIQTLKSYEQEQNDIPNEKVEGKKIEFLISKQSAEKSCNDVLKDHIGVGLNKLLSNQQKKRISKNNCQAEVIIEPHFRKLGNPNKFRMHNHLQFHWNVSNKKALYYNLKKFYQGIKENPFEYIPLTFHIQKYGDEEWQNFVQAFKERGQGLKSKEGKGKKKKQKNLWIVKPGQNSNQGNGIQVFDNLQQIADLVKTSGDRGNGRNRSYIVQRYLMPLLYNKRKFDIRTYVLVTNINGIMKAYWYEEGYIRTSCKQFSIKNLKNRFIHLTNDAVQKKCEDYGKYENGNKVSYSDFQRYLQNAFPDKQLKFYQTVYPAMMKRAADVIKSASLVMDSNRRQFTFELFGLDYMIDDEFNTWLIEVNTNPCLEVGSPLLSRIIPSMIENVLKIAVDPLFPPPKEYPKTKTVPSELFEANKFTLIFNSSEEQQTLAFLNKDANLSNIIESDDEDQNHDDIQ